MQEFKLDKKYVTLTKGCLVVFVTFLALGFALPFLPDEHEGNPNDTLMISAMCTMVYGVFSALTWRFLKKLPFADIAADDDGVWYMHIGKAKGLIDWEKVHRVKERPYMQRLDLLGTDNQELLKIDYKLLGFEILRDVLNERAGARNSDLYQSKFSKGPLYHLVYLACVVSFTALGIYIGAGSNPLLGYGVTSVLVAFIIYEYLVAATGVQVTENSILVAYPLTKKNIPLNDVENVVIADEFRKGKRIPEIWIITNNSKKSYKLKQLGSDSDLVYKTLKRAANL
ncbi:hypothetical protein QCD60_17585 [Pokkaliibacter sp. MBI-7]|uniref:hypothetical protein n=1 Tax=Pokkaliibacter sp. MBI-7 TaxID=3040600 RepID=UPI002449BD0D|nr:hypothetical protein [Pokkaliibacter sp. MBI-7]MDH2434374.1 hypothetical protein [Pokkaliibacter sp. MBI-7]